MGASSTYGTLRVAAVARAMIVGSLAIVGARGLRRVHLATMGAERVYWGGNIDPSEVSIAGMTWALLYPAWTLAAGLAFVWWLRAVYRELPNHDAKPRRRIHWSWLGFLVPFMNFYVPYGMVREVWRRTATYDDDIGTGFILAWWFAWQAYFFAGLTLTTRSGYAHVVHTVLYFAAGLLALRVVKRVSERVETNSPDSVPRPEVVKQPETLRLTWPGEGAPYRERSEQLTVEVASDAGRVDHAVGVGWLVIAAFVPFTCSALFFRLPSSWWGGVCLLGGLAGLAWARQGRISAGLRRVRVTDTAWETPAGRVLREKARRLRVFRHWAEPSAMVPRFGVQLEHEGIDDGELYDTELFRGMTAGEAAYARSVLVELLPRRKRRRRRRRG